MKGKITQVYAGLFAGLIYIFLGCKYNHLGRLPLWAVCLEILIMISALAILLLPSYLLHKSTGCDASDIFIGKASVGKIVFSSLYCILFVFACVRFISLYADILITALNPDANKFVFAAGILLVCAYSAYKGVFTATRSALLCAVAAALFVIIFLLGNISDVELNNLYRSNSTDDFFVGAFSLLPVCILPVIFSAVSGSFSHRKSAFFGFLITALVSACLLVFFMNTVLADYADGREFPYFILAQNASFGQMTSFDFLYMICISLCIFVVGAILLCCINETTGAQKRGKNTAVFTLLIFVLYICTEVFPKAKELVHNDIIFAVMCAIYSLVMPMYAYFKLKGGVKNV